MKAQALSLDFTRREVVDDPLYQAAHQAAERLLHFVGAAPTAWQAVAEGTKMLEAAGFRAYDARQSLKLKAGSRGYFTMNGSALLAFVIGKKPLQGPLRLYGAHSDSPALRIKPHAIQKAEGVLRLSTEVYGGPLLQSYFDRPLSLAGRVVLRGKTPFAAEDRLIDFQEPLLILPNLAIHMNREQNDGWKIERAKVLLPFLAPAPADDSTPSAAKNKPALTDETELLLRLIAEKLEVAQERILDFDLFTYAVEAPSFCGLHDAWIHAPRLDNLAAAEAGLHALSHLKGRPDGIRIVFISDNEEVGSRSKQGADSFLARDLLERLVLALDGSREDFFRLLAGGFMLSNDSAHGVHPNFPEAADGTHRPRLNGGPVIKLAANQSYSSDAHSMAIFRALAEEAGVPCQIFVNHSDKRGGSTIGPISSAYLPLPTVDIGNPLWGMHSIRETGGMLDHYFLDKVLERYFS